MAILGRGGWNEGDGNEGDGRRSGDDAFQFKEPEFAVEADGRAGPAASRPDHPVARHDQGYGIAVESAADGPCGRAGNRGSRRSEG